MPFKYINNKMRTIEPIKPVEEMSTKHARDLINLIDKYDPMRGYNAQEADLCVEIVRAYIDNMQANCAHCGTGGSIRAVKDKLYTFLNNNRSTVEAIANQTFNPIVEEQPTLEELEEEIERLNANEKPKKKSTYKPKPKK